MPKTSIAGLVFVMNNPQLHDLLGMREAFDNLPSEPIQNDPEAEAILAGDLEYGLENWLANIYAP